MTNKRTKKKAPQRTAKQSHYYQVSQAIEITANSFFVQLGYEPMPENLKTSMIAGIIFPKAPYENPQRYFDFSGMTPLQVEEALRKLRGSMPIDLLIKGNVLAVYRLIKKSFPPVKLA